MVMNEKVQVVREDTEVDFSCPFCNVKLELVYFEACSHIIDCPACDGNFRVYAGSYFEVVV